MEWWLESWHGRISASVGWRCNVGSPSLPAGTLPNESLYREHVFNEKAFNDAKS